MAKPPNNVWKLSETLTLCEFTDPKNGSYGFWLYDKTRGQNLSIQAKTRDDAFVDALTYYQKRLALVESSLNILQIKVDAFIDQFREEEE